MPLCPPGWVEMGVQEHINRYMVSIARFFAQTNISAQPAWIDGVDMCGCMTGAGNVLFVPATTQLTLESDCCPVGAASSTGQEEEGLPSLRVWIAAVNDIFFQLPDTSSAAKAVGAVASV